MGYIFTQMNDLSRELHRKSTSISRISYQPVLLNSRDKDVRSWSSIRDTEFNPFCSYGAPKAVKRPIEIPVDITQLLPVTYTYFPDGHLDSLYFQIYRYRPTEVLTRILV